MFPKLLKWGKEQLNIMVTSRGDRYAKMIEILLISYMEHFKADWSSISEKKKVENCSSALFEMRI